MSSSNASDVVLRSQDVADDIYLLGSVDYSIRGAKLPSNGQVLRVFFYLCRIVKLEPRESARLAVREALIFWKKARIPTRQDYHCVEKLLEMHEDWKAIAKSKKRSNELQKKREKTFVDKLDNLFDIAHADAMTLIRNQNDKDFLLKQFIASCMPPPYL